MRSESAGILYWRGSPDCQAAHSEIVSFLRLRTHAFLPDEAATSESQKGNLGEHIAFRIGDANDFAGWGRYIKNAHEPLSTISTSGVDIIWFFLHESEPALDAVAIQETKTTADTSLDYAYKLTQDYKKLFDRDPSLSLGSRLSILATYLELGLGFDETVIHRITRMGAERAALASQIKLVPTLVHDKSADATAKLLAVRTSIGGLGWDTSRISPWSISLSSIGERLERIAHGKD